MFIFFSVLSSSSLFTVKTRTLIVIFSSPFHFSFKFQPIKINLVFHWRMLAFWLKPLFSRRRIIAMEIPVINRISGFEAEINRLQNPSLISRHFNLQGIKETSQFHSFWIWGALILAFVATFSSVINRTKLVIFRFWKDKSVISEPLLQTFSDYDEDETYSSSFSSDDEDEPTLPLVENQKPMDEDYGIEGSDNYDEDEGQNRKVKLHSRRSSGDCYSWTDYANGENVVKLWDGFGLGLGFKNSSGNLISMWDFNKNEIRSSFSAGRCQIPAMFMMSPAVLVSAGLENNTNVALRIWDVRVGRQISEVFAEWQSLRTRVVGIDSGGVEKVYVRDDDSSVVAVRDMRNFRLPFESSMEYDGKSWWGC